MAELVIHQEGQEYVWKLVFNGITRATTLYVGLANTSGAGYAQTVTLAALTGELTSGAEPGYARVAVAATAEGIPVSLNETEDCWEALISALFSATDDWTASADTWFVATTADGTGKLLFSGIKDVARLLTADDSLTQIIKPRIANPVVA